VVDIAGKMAAHAAPDEILISATVRDLVGGSGIAFHRKGLLNVDESTALTMLWVERTASLADGA
jgi:class 3 adenylate cyclase